MKEMTTLQDWEQCLQDSETNPVLVFKHSTRCSISAMAESIVHRYDAGPAVGRPEVYLVKVVEYRPVSDEVARTLNVQHKSPQLILVRNREAVWSTSHYNITSETIQSAIDQFYSAEMADKAQ